MDSILNIVQHIQIKDVIDILIVAFLFYRLLYLIKETRAEQLVKGFFIIIVIAQVSQWAKFYAIGFLLNNILTVGLIALVVVFQPELRKALEHIGRSRLVGAGALPLSDQNQILIDEVVEACGLMSRQKIGALIVIERHVGINDIIDTGTMIDATVSSSLITNIFFPKAPLHDGALVVKGGKLEAAACILPLSSNRLISKELGTRHRAAMGMIESSDAMVVVVSEETGAISVAVNGELFRFLDTDTLREKMVEGLTEDNEPALIKSTRRDADENN